MNALEFLEMKKRGEKISMLTCYDYWSAQILSESSIDGILVGDSLAMVMHGHGTTLPASVGLMATHVAAVARGAPNKFIVGDLPFLSYRKSLDENMMAVEKIMQAGAHAVKAEGVAGNEEFIAHTVTSGVPVMGHIGLTPQAVNQLGGFKVQGRNKKTADEILDQAKKLENLGCFSVVLECVPASLAAAVSEAIAIPTIGIGAGPGTDGQILVLQDMLGMQKGFHPKFLRKYLQGFEQIATAVANFNNDVKKAQFPAPEESYE